MPKDKFDNEDIIYNEILRESLIDPSNTELKKTDKEDIGVIVISLILAIIAIAIFYH